MKYIGCLYIIWLAWKVAMAKPAEKENSNAKIGFATGFILQFVNIKIVIYGMTAYSGFVLPYHESILALLAAMCVLTVIGSAGTVVWALAGSILQRFFHRYARLSNAVMGVMLLACVIPLVFDF